MKWEPAGSRMWHGYPQPIEAHSERPWWRREAKRWVRIDGRAAPDEYGEVETQGLLRVRPRIGPDLAALDAAEPLDAPPPLVGQVWAFERERVTAVVVAVVDRDEGPLVLIGGADQPAAVWPPPGAVLVAGPLSPWAEMGSSEKSDNVRNP